MSFTQRPSKKNEWGGIKGNVPGMEKKMADQKIENLLELSLDVSEEDRMKSENLSAGYDPEEERWEVIFKYSGEKEEIARRYGAVTFLYGGYAIATLSRQQIQTLAADAAVEYIEKPKALNFAVYNGKLISCITPVQRNPWNLTGRGVLVGIIDSGIDINHPDFRNEDGTTRLAGLWDQTLSLGTPPAGYARGTYFTRQQINEYLDSGETFPTRDLSGHGTHVAGIAAGNGRASRGEQRGVAYEADILVVKLRGQSRNGFPQTADLMAGVDFCVRTAVEWSQPLALNLSYGNNYGSHDGTSLLESYLDTAAAVGRTTICVGSGNEGNQARHAFVRMEEGQSYLVEFIVAPGEYSMGLQLWKNYSDEFEITLISPAGNQVIISENVQGSYTYELDGTQILIYIGEPAPYSVDQEIYMEFVPGNVRTDIANGVWKILLNSVRIVEGSVNFWLPGGGSINTDTGFLRPDSHNTLTIPSTARLPITVGAYDGNTGSFAAFSGTGAECMQTAYCRMVKPDLVAPGVNIISCSPGGGYTARTGTSMACPFVTGSAALLMQYGIIDGRDPYLYGQKIKAYLTRGARPLMAFSEYPNSIVGYGALCLRDSLPG